VSPKPATVSLLTSHQQPQSTADRGGGTRLGTTPHLCQKTSLRTRRADPAGAFCPQRRRDTTSLPPGLRSAATARVSPLPGGTVSVTVTRWSYYGLYQMTSRPGSGNLPPTLVSEDELPRCPRPPWRPPDPSVRM